MTVPHPFVLLITAAGFLQHGQHTGISQIHPCTVECGTNTNVHATTRMIYTPLEERSDQRLEDLHLDKTNMVERNNVNKVCVDGIYLDRFPGSLHEVSPLQKFIVFEFELPWIRLHDT